MSADSDSVGVPRVSKTWLLCTVSLLTVLACATFARRFSLTEPLAAHSRSLAYALSVGLAIVPFAGIWRRRPRPLLTWFVFAASPCAIVLSEIVSVLLPDASYPSPSTYLNLCSVLMMVIFLSLVLRHRSSGVDAAGIIDASIIAMAALLASWVFVIGPQAHAPDVALAVKSVDIASTVFDLVTIWLCVQMVFDGGDRRTAFRLMALSFVGAAIFDSAKFALVLSDMEMTWMTFGRNACYILSVTAILHPSVNLLTQRSKPKALHTAAGRLRISLLTLASLVTPALLLVERSRGTTKDLTFISACSAVMLFLIIARMEGMIRKQAKTNAALDDSIRRLHAADLQLRHAQKLEAVGKLAGGMAHEINTPIQFIDNNIRFLQTSFDTMDEMCVAYRSLLPTDVLESSAERQRADDLEFFRQEVPAGINDALAGTERITKIVSALKVFGGTGSEAPEVVDIHAAINSTIAVTEPDVRPVADVMTELGTVPNVLCFPGDLNQILFHLIDNAAQAIRDAQSSPDDRGCITVTTTLVDDVVEIRVSDTGVGIPENIRHRIFDPFFTTREVGAGTGQGLTLAWNLVVERCHGSLTVQSEEGVGTTFVVRLPPSAS